MRMKEAPSALLDVRETSSLLGINPNTLYGMIARGDCPIEPVRIGKRVRFRRVDLESLLGVSLRDN